MAYIINADTPEEMRRAIVELLEHLASQKRREATMATRKTAAKEHDIRAMVYETTACFISKIDIQPLRKSAYYNPEGEKPNT